MTNDTIAPQDLRQRLRDIIDGNGRELAFLDVREDGQRGMGHPLLSVGLHYSTLETMVGRLVPRRATPIVLMDGGDGVSERAAKRLATLGYSDIAVLGVASMPGSPPDTSCSWDTTWSASRSASWSSTPATRRRSPPKS